MTEIIQADADHITITERCVHGADGLTYCCPDLGSRSAVIVMDGERGRNLRDKDHPERPWKVVDWGRIYPPAQVRRLTEPCRCRCHTDAMYRQLHDDGICPDCHNGKPTFTLHQGCAHCHDTGDTSDGRPCWKCNGRGYIDLGDGWVIRDVLPMLDGDVRRDTYPDDALYFTKGEGWWRDTEFDKIITLPSAARPGQYVILAQQNPNQGES